MIVADVAVSLEGNMFVESNSFDEVLFDFAAQLTDTSIGPGEFLMHLLSLTVMNHDLAT